MNTSRKRFVCVWSKNSFNLFWKQANINPYRTTGIPMWRRYFTFIRTFLFCGYPMCDTSKPNKQKNHLPFWRVVLPCLRFWGILYYSRYRMYVLLSLLQYTFMLSGVSNSKTNWHFVSESLSIDTMYLPFSMWYV